MRVKVGTVAYVEVVGSGFGIGLDGDGHRVEFLGDWRSFVESQPGLYRDDPVYVDLEDWQVLAVDDEVRLPLNPEGMVARTAFVRSALAKGGTSRG